MIYIQKFINVCVFCYKINSLFLIFTKYKTSKLINVTHIIFKTFKIKQMEKAENYNN